MYDDPFLMDETRVISIIIGVFIITSSVGMGILGIFVIAPVFSIGNVMVDIEKGMIPAPPYDTVNIVQIISMGEKKWDVIVKLLDVENNTIVYDRFDYYPETMTYANYELIIPIKNMESIW